MTEIRFSYNPFNEDFLECATSHSVTIYNKGKQKQFAEYIRGIILNNILYIRLYYPFENIDNLTQAELKQKSFQLSSQYLPNILKKLKKTFGICPVSIQYNVENDLLSGLSLANI